MRQIGFINETPDAERFGNYLLAQGIPNHIEQMAGGAWAVWIEDDDHLDRGRTELEQFRANPTDPRYKADKQAEKIRKEAAKAEKRRREKFVDVRTSWSNPARFMRPVTIALVVLSVIVGIGTKLGRGEPTSLENALRIAPIELVGNGIYQWNYLNAIKGGEVWRLVTPVLLHYGIFHLLFNMLWLLDLGSMIETRRGPFRFVAFVLFAAITSNLAQYFWSGPTFGGMSGVVYALLGYAWMKGRFEPHLGIGVSQQTLTFMLIWLVVCMTGIVGPVANLAHFVGLAAGVAIAYAPYGVQRMRRKMR